MRIAVQLALVLVLGGAALAAVASTDPSYVAEPEMASKPGECGKIFMTPVDGVPVLALGTSGKPADIMVIVAANGNWTAVDLTREPIVCILGIGNAAEFL